MATFHTMPEHLRPAAAQSVPALRLAYDPHVGLHVIDKNDRSLGVLMVDSWDVSREQPVMDVTQFGDTSRRVSPAGPAIFTLELTLTEFVTVPIGGTVAPAAAPKRQAPKKIARTGPSVLRKDRVS